MCMSKPLDRLTLLQTFVRIVDAGSISAAAGDLGITQPSASRHLAELEERLKSQLVRRNTHGLALTDSGAELLADARAMLDAWEVLEEKHINTAQTVAGKLKIVAPLALGQLHLARILAKFQTDYPLVSINWELDDREIRFSETGCDCWIKVGPVPDDTLIVKKLGSVERILVASKGFVETNGMPKRPSQAEAYNTIGLVPFEGGKIPLSNKQGKTVYLQPPLKTTTNNIFALKELVISGVGMAVLPRWFINRELSEKQLVNLLGEWKAPSLDIHIAYLPSKHQPLRLRAFVELMVREVGRIPGII